MTQSRIVFFFCPDCISMIKQVPTVKGEVAEMRREIEDLKSKVSADKNAPSFAENLVETKGIKDQLNLNEKVKRQVSLSVPVAPNQTQIKPAVSELQEGGKKAKNILIFGVDEISAENKEASQRRDREGVIVFTKE